eukprot:2763406-Prymnesium_polylepis.1
MFTHCTHFLPHRLQLHLNYVWARAARRDLNAAHDARLQFIARASLLPREHRHQPARLQGAERHEGVALSAVHRATQ